jgi:hypothetical protein
MRGPGDHFCEVTSGCPGWKLARLAPRRARVSLPLETQHTQRCHARAHARGERGCVKFVNFDAKVHKVHSLTRAGTREGGERVRPFGEAQDWGPCGGGWRAKPYLYPTIGREAAEADLIRVFSKLSP